MNVHLKYDTIDHYHFDWLTPAGDHPNSAVMLVGCRDGRWIIVQEFGNDYSCFEGVLENVDDLNTEPKFCSDLKSVAVAAFGMMKQIYPQYDDSTLGRDADLVVMVDCQIPSDDLIVHFF
ncbi:hypothetical protein ACOY6A_23465 [Enterobacter roggenkampii]|uniref:hypothetical protein n=1 Tax=Enterobacter roggenkampii TaxID=1812935 RepID=UPI003BC808BA